MTKLKIGIGRYDRTQALIDGRIRIEGCESIIESHPLEQLFARAFDNSEFDVAELSFSNYVYLTSQGECPYVALPIFPSRMFRHSAIFIRSDREITSARDLIGRAVGVREFSMTAALVARGVLEDEYGVPAASIRWHCGPADRYDSKPIIRAEPQNIEVSILSDGQNLSDMLAGGQLDALIAYKPPKCFIEGHPKVTRLFPDHVAVERDYFARTGIFPIMHLVGIRRELMLDAKVCLAICNAFEKAKTTAATDLSTYQTLSVALPWVTDDLRRVIELMGNNNWPYGIAANSKAIEAICRYSYSQGLAPRVIPVRELFAPPTVDWEPAKT